jgi:heme exporter protein D
MASPVSAIVIGALSLAKSIVETIRERRRERRERKEHKEHRERERKEREQAPE